MKLVSDHFGCKEVLGAAETTLQLLSTTLQPIATFVTNLCVCVENIVWLGYNFSYHHPWHILFIAFRC